jgi:TonB family protein
VQAAPVKQLSPEGKEYFEFQVEKPARVANSVTPKYPEILRQAGVEGETLVSFVVDETGVADPATFKVIKSTHELFATAVRQALPGMRFTPAEIGGKKVKQVVQAPFSFSIAGNKVQSGEVLSSSNTTYVTGADGQKKLAFTVRRSDAVAAKSPYVTIVSSDGRELASGTSDDLLNRVAPETIKSIEVFKAGDCAPWCPLIKITLARGKTLGPPTLVRPNREEPAAAWEPKAEKRAERPVNRIEAISSRMNFELLDSSGQVVARYGSREAMKGVNINSEDISASETYNGKTCTAPGQTACPLTRIWLKPGREAAYRKR